MSHCRHTSLAPFTTFGLDNQAKNILTVTTPDSLATAWRQAAKEQQPTLILGEGSNVLFLEDYSGTILLNRIKGVDVTEDADFWYLRVGAGENWHQLVSYMLEKGIPGLENLALIPGCAGSAPIQNIGAYGIEFKNICDYVDVLDLRSSESLRFTTQDCQFGYRESIFKHNYRDGYAIVAVGLRLAKRWEPVLTYGDLMKLDPQSVTPREVFNSVCHMRRTKLPDPKVTGNVGSFFKNPLVDTECANKIRASNPDMPMYPQADGSIKLAAGWLIDRCGLKGLQIGGAAVHQQQALVLINKDHATSQNVIDLAKAVREQVAKNFSVWLEPEVRFISAQGEVNAVEVLS